MRAPHKIKHTSLRVPKEVHYVRYYLEHVFHDAWFYTQLYIR